MRSLERVAVLLLALSMITLSACAADDQIRSDPLALPTQKVEEMPQPARSRTIPIDGASPLETAEDGLDLVFSGGGAKGIAHIGALAELEKRGVTYRRLVGTSSGSIMALMLASGYSADEMAAAITERTPDGKIIMAKFLDVPDSFPEESVRGSFLYTLINTTFLSALPQQLKGQMESYFVEELVQSPVVREVFSFTEFGGVFAGDVFLQWLAQELDQNGRDLSQLTLAEFQEETGGDLTAVVTDVTDQRMLIVNHRTAPQLPVIMLIRMSMSIPLIYNNVIWQAEWGHYMGEDISGHEMVDGGIASNFGIETVVSNDPQFVEAMGTAPDRARVLGFYLDDAIPVPGIEETGPEVEEDNDPLNSSWEKVTDRNIDLFNAVLRSHDRFVVRTHPDVVCHLPVGGIGTMEFDMSEERVELLLLAGQEAMAQCLDELGME